MGNANQPEGNREKPLSAMLFRVGLLLTVTVLGLGLSAAHAQEDREVPPSGGLLGAFRRAFHQGSRPMGRAITPPGAALVCTRDYLQVYTTNAYSEEGVRYLAVQLRFKNNSPEPVTVFSKRSQLTIGTEVYLRVQTREELKSQPLVIDGEAHDVEALQGKPDQIIPPGGMTWVWLVFAKLSRDRELPETTLKVVTTAGEIEVNLTKFEADALTFRSERIGPKNCIGVLHVTGELNSFNAGRFMRELTAAAEQGASRAVVVFERGSRIGDPLIPNWLIYGREQDSERFEYLPLWAGQVKDIAFVNIPGMADESETNLASTEDDGVLIVSRRLVAQLDAATLRQELLTGHPMVRRAVLLSAGEAIANDDPQLIVPLLTTQDGDSRMAAIHALRAATDPEVIAPLESIVRNGSSKESFQALSALMASPLPAARDAAVALASEPALQRKIGLLKILHRLPVESQPRWVPWLRTLLEDQSPVVRSQALRLLLLAGVQDRYALLSKALADPHESVRNAALDALLVHRTIDEELLFRTETRRRIESGSLDRRSRLAIRELADRSALPVLLKEIDQHLGTDDGLVNLYLEIGGHEALPAIVQRYSQFSAGTRSEILRQVKLAGDPQWVSLAIDGLDDADEDHGEFCLHLLADLSDSSVLPKLVAAWQKSSEDQSKAICHTIGSIGTPAARETLEEMLKAAPESRHSEIKEGIVVWDQLSPAMDILREVEALTQVDKWQQASDIYTFALEVSPRNPRLYSSRGHTRLRMGQFDAAEEDFRHAMELEPDNHNSLSGLAICKAIHGEYEAAIQMVHTPELLEKYKLERVYLYNIACVYGRSIEHVLNEPDSKERDQKILGYREQAIQFLQKSIELGFNEGHLLATDPDLNSLREIPAFQKLREELPDEPQE